MHSFQTHSSNLSCKNSPLGKWELTHMQRRIYCLRRNYAGINSFQTDSSNLSCKKSKAWKWLATTIKSKQGLSLNKISNFHRFGEFPNLVVCNFTLFALFGALLRSFALFCIFAFALFCTLYSWKHSSGSAISLVPTIYKKRVSLPKCPWTCLFTLHACWMSQVRFSRLARCYCAIVTLNNVQWNLNSLDCQGFAKGRFPKGWFWRMFPGSPQPEPG